MLKDFGIYMYKGQWDVSLYPEVYKNIEKFTCISKDGAFCSGNPDDRLGGFIGAPLAYF